MSLHLTPAQIAEGTISAFVAGIAALEGIPEDEVRRVAEMTALVTHKRTSVVLDIVFNYLRITEERREK